jgi:hypothetical protein
MAEWRFVASSLFAGERSRIAAPIMGSSFYNAPSIQ